MTATLKNSTQRVTLAALLMVTGATLANAQGSAQEREACTPDVFRLCSADIPNVDRIVACLNRDKSRLSPACRAVMNGSDKAESRSRARS